MNKVLAMDEVQSVIISFVHRLMHIAMGSVSTVCKAHFAESRIQAIEWCREQWEANWRDPHGLHIMEKRQGCNAQPAMTILEPMGSRGHRG